MGRIFIDIIYIERVGISYILSIINEMTSCVKSKFHAKGVGTKYKTIHIWSYPQNLAIPCYY